MSQIKTILKGKKVILRPLKISDAVNFCKWLGDLEVTKFLSIYDQPAPTLKEERDWVKRAQKSKDNLRLAIETIDGRHIGIVSLRDIKNPNKHAEYGIIIGDKEYWGQGFGTETCKLIVDYGFRKLKLHRIYLTCIAYNVRGQKSYAKAGFKIEGRLREQIYRDGFFHDEIYMGLLKEEYLSAGRQGFKKSRNKKMIK